MMVARYQQLTFENAKIKIKGGSLEIAVMMLMPCLTVNKCTLSEAQSAMRTQASMTNLSAQQLYSTLVHFTESMNVV